MPRPSPRGTAATATPRQPEPASRPAHAPECSWVFPAPFGFVLSVPLASGEYLVPLAASSAAALAPLASALDVVRASGGFEVETVRHARAEVRLDFERVPDMPRAKKRVETLARDLLAVGLDALAPRHRSRFRPAIELRASGAQRFSVHLYGEGSTAADERPVLRLSEGMLPALTRLVEAGVTSSVHTVVRHHVQVRCRVELSEFMARVPARRPHQPARERHALDAALRWLAAARCSSALALAHNDLVLSPVAEVARALGQNAYSILADGQRYAFRFGSAAPLARVELEGRTLAGALELPCGLEPRARRHDARADLARRLVASYAAEDVARLSACMGLAAHLASVQAAVAVALWSLARTRSSAAPTLATHACDAASRGRTPAVAVRGVTVQLGRDDARRPSARPWAVLEQPGWPPRAAETQAGARRKPGPVQGVFERRTRRTRRTGSGVRPRPTLQRPAPREAR